MGKEWAPCKGAATSSSPCLQRPFRAPIWGTLASPGLKPRAMLHRPFRAALCRRHVAEGDAERSDLLTAGKPEERSDDGSPAAAPAIYLRTLTASLPPRAGHATPRPRTPSASARLAVAPPRVRRLHCVPPPYPRLTGRSAPCRLQRHPLATSPRRVCSAPSGRQLWGLPIPGVKTPGYVAPPLQGGVLHRIVASLRVAFSDIPCNIPSPCFAAPLQGAYCGDVGFPGVETLSITHPYILDCLTRH